LLGRGVGHPYLTVTSSYDMKTYGPVGPQVDLRLFGWRKTRDSSLLHIDTPMPAIQLFSS